MKKRDLMFSMIALGLLSCSPKNQYIINLEKPTQSPKPIHKKVGISSLTLPNYLLKYPIAKRVGKSKIEYLEAHIWADRLDDSLRRELIKVLQAHSTNSEIINYPWGALPDVSVEIVINEFIAANNGVVLDATVKLYFHKSQKTLIHRFNQSKPFSGKNEDIAVTMSLLFNDFVHKLSYILAK